MNGDMKSDTRRRHRGWRATRGAQVLVGALLVTAGCGGGGATTSHSTSSTTPVRLSASSSSSASSATWTALRRCLIPLISLARRWLPRSAPRSCADRCTSCPETSRARSQPSRAFEEVPAVPTEQGRVSSTQDTDDGGEHRRLVWRYAWRGSDGPRPGLSSPTTGLRFSVMAMVAPRRERSEGAPRHGRRGGRRRQ